ncbi:FAD-dependent monooxygenase [Nonomuraea spiralis]|uniref:FAD-dependent monooxygenase n=1 Tax=Nonomuraea spiralis TaxID=46182 RepID=A0ABV5I9V1_9ACTN|nr:FAD-dependent monooxygenase [Nonomuraea spiralis]GGT09485.1 FAD-dependent oxidoreductase [Nonomuraea spiralis]
MKAVLISGGGVAGPTLAHWLARNGFRPTIVERAPSLRTGGQAVDFRGAPQLEVLDRMGVLDAVRAACTGMGDIAIVDSGGRRLARLPSEVFSGEVEILRGDLSRILNDAAPAERLFGDSITSLTERPEGVHVTFEKAAPRTFDLVVGADGIRSKVRELTFPATPLHHLGFHSAVFTVPGTYGLEHDGLEHDGLMYNVPGRCATVVRTGGRTRAALDFATPPLDRDHLDHLDHLDHATQRALVAEAFRGVGWQVPSLLAAMEEAEDFYLWPAAQVVLPRLSSGRVALVGDAGYAPGPGGMGTGLGMIGAYVLAGELAAAPDDHRAAFAAYERRMRPYVEVCQKQAKGADKYLVPGRRSQIWRRNQLMRMLPYLPGKSLIKRMTEKAASAVTLPDHTRPDARRPAQPA